MHLRQGFSEVVEIGQAALGRSQVFCTAVTIEVQGAEHVFVAQPRDAFVQRGG